jgi:hypothetical protein
VIQYSVGEIRKLKLESFNDKLLRDLNFEFHYFENSPQQIEAWKTSARWIFESLITAQTTSDNLRIIFEFAPPITTDRPDIVIVSDDYILVVEVKTGTQESLSQAKNQVLRYARHIYNYIDVGQVKTVVPVLLRQAGKNSGTLSPGRAEPKREQIIDLAPSHLGTVLSQMGDPKNYEETETKNWLYAPRPSIVDAARMMFNSNSDRNILSAMADDEELTELVNTCISLIRKAKSERSHFVLAVSGVPGAGKTLVGLRLANSPTVQELCVDEGYSPPLYLSGNGPLVDVLTEALSRDHRFRTGSSATEALEIAQAKIRLIHGLTTNKFAVRTHALVFDEAQRAWSEEQMRRKTGDQALSSEATEVLRRMEDLDWSVVICLVGTGQQINDGEKGMITWTKAITERALDNRTWRLYGDARSAGLDGADTRQIIDEPKLHLTHVRRADNASMLGDWVNELLNGNIENARAIRSEFAEFPVFVTRSLESARSWLLNPSRQRSETFGLLASSKSARLSKYGVDTQSSASMDHPWAQWFLDRPPNLNSSELLEIAASEFKCQGLELDRTCVCWSWDLIFQNNGWVTRRINKRTGKWGGNKARREYAINTYRVLLTRSRAGMVIWVPIGDDRDISRNSGEMDLVFDTLLQAGCSKL